METNERGSERNKKNIGKRKRTEEDERSKGKRKEKAISLRGKQPKPASVTQRNDAVRKLTKRESLQNTIIFGQ